MNAADYRKQLELLLPSGSAIDPQAGSVLLKLLGGFAEELARIEARGRDLIDEADPRTTTEIFQEWLAIIGIPDGCSIYAVGGEDERSQLIQRLVKQAGQTPIFYQELAEALGYLARTEEFFPATAGFETGSLLCDEGWRFVFSVKLSDVADRARAGSALSGGRVTEFSSPFLFCVLQTAKPGHTVAFVGFEEMGS